MKLTNKLNLPDALVNACMGFDKNYQKGRGTETRLSVTQLINSPYQTQLQKKHWEDLEEDVSDRIWSILGSAVHGILEHSAGSDSLTEERLYTETEGVWISGQADHYHDGVLSDYKITSAWSVIYGKDEWSYQLNILGYLYELAGFPINKLQIVAILRDWSKGKAEQGGNYPQASVQVVPIEKWDRQKVVDYITERVKLHLNPNPEPCSEKDRWHKSDVFAVMKKDRKSAVKLYNTKEGAEEHLKKEKLFGDKNYYIETRPGEDTRCENYCSVRKFCPFKNGG